MIGNTLLFQVNSFFLPMASFFRFD